MISGLNDDKNGVLFLFLFFCFARDVQMWAMLENFPHNDDLLLKGLEHRILKGGV